MAGDNKPTATKDFSDIYQRDRAKFKKLQKIKKYHIFRGSKFTPMFMDKWGHERDRLGLGMTNEDRSLRKQFLSDQHLGHDEPRYVPELRPRNFFRRLIAWPWDFVFNVLKPVIGDAPASWARKMVPRFALGAAVFYSGVYYFTYRPANWTTKKGIYVMPVERPKVMPDDPVVWRDPKDNEFFDRGYRFRTVLRDVDNVTSTNFVPTNREEVTYFPEGDRVDLVNPLAPNFRA